MRTLFIAALTFAALAGCTPEGSNEPPGSELPTTSAAASLRVELSDFMLQPDALVATGSTVVIQVTNAGPTPHNFSIRDADGNLLAATADLSTGDAETLRLDLEPGEYTTFCGLPGHESLGMMGTLVVEAS